ncbi:MAG: arsenate reductase ArsC [Deltaproteobacteria bacterium]|nr:arsenate reductase ArsC [Deltaproteobacteria bacterium]
MKKQKVLFVCTRNSARSQIAESWLNFLYGDRFEAKSAGLEPGDLNSLAVTVMEEKGIDISRNRTKSVFEILKAGELFSWVITVCDSSSAERCPVFPGSAKRLHWSFPDPSSIKGSLEERTNAVRKIRDEIKETVRQWGAPKCVRPLGRPTYVQPTDNFMESL